jgi:hypothetical protein
MHLLSVVTQIVTVAIEAKIEAKLDKGSPLASSRRSIVVAGN